MGFVRFTDPDGQHIWIAARWVTRLREPLPNRYAKNARTLIVMGNSEQAVTESINDVLRMLEGAPPDA